MGGAIRLILYAPNTASAEAAATAAYARIAALEDVMSDYRPTSEVSRLAQRAGQGPQPVSADLARVLTRAQAVARSSGGAFDVTCGPLVKLWREARTTRRLPETASIRQAKAAVGWRFLRLDDSPSGPTADLRQPGLRLDLGGIAKGDAGDQALAVLRQNGVTRALIEAGGDLVAGDPPPGERGWRVQVRGAPREVRWLANQAMSTSGDAEQFLEINGVRYSHIVDPRDGKGVTHRHQVSVIAPTGLQSDPLATALSVLGPRSGGRLAVREGVEVIWVGPKATLPPQNRSKWSMLEP